MKILIDINHPAHVHYFRNFIKEMEKKGHEIFVTARDKEVSYKLLESYKIEFKSKGKGRKSLSGKIINMFRENLLFFSLFLKFKPDITLSAGSTSLAQVSWIFRVPHFALDDTEHAKMAKKLYLPFSKYAFTPINYFTNLGKKQIRVEYFTELCYLHPNWYKPNNVNLQKPYAVLRFVSWEANHDIGQSGIDYESKKEVIKLLEEKGYNIYISSEGKLELEFQKYQISISPEKMHDVLYHANLFVAESGTMASEAIILGTPTVYINTLNMCYIEDLKENYGLISLRSADQLLQKIDQITNNDTKEAALLNSKKIIAKKIDFSSFLIWFVENFSDSEKELLKDKNLPNKFK